MEQRLVSSLTPSECAKRLSQVAPMPSLFGSFLPNYGTREMHGAVRGDSFYLWVRMAWIVFHGRLRSSSEGTVVVGEFRMRRLVRIFMTVWFGGIIGVACLGVIVASLGFVAIGASGFVVFVVVGGFGTSALLGWGLFCLRRALGRSEEELVLEYLKTALGCDPEK